MLAYLTHKSSLHAILVLEELVLEERKNGRNEEWEGIEAMGGTDNRTRGEDKRVGS